MKNKNIKNLALIIGILLFASGLQPIFAYTIELEILGGGYQLIAPTKLKLNPVTSSFNPAISSINFRDTEMTTPDQITESGGIIIIDENGGNPFSVTVSATTLTNSEGNCANNPENCINLENFFIKNFDDNSESNEIESIFGHSFDFSLATETNNFVDLSEPQTLGNGTGQGPGYWKIFPTIQIQIPEGQKPGEYTSTLTFTIA